jgi:NADH-quinone oxidoreductase subunit L
MLLGDQTIYLVLGLPLLGFLIQAFFGGAVVRRLGPARGRKVMGTLAVLPIALAFVFSAAITFSLANLPPESRTLPPAVLFDWIAIAGLRIPFELVVDPLSMTMALIITGIGALIHLYATGYMAEERDYTRFFTYLNLFIAAMLILVLGNNLALMFIGWEGVGLCSYLLIGFWYQDIANAKAANKAFIVNRIGDWGFTLGMFLIVAFFAGNAETVGAIGADHRWLSYDVLLPNAVRLLQNNPGIATAIALLLFVGAMGKSAQFPLYNWLPDAMAGPTPVSALIHAATMVTAGVFMLNRMSVFFELSPTAMGVVTVIGAFTALFAALIAFGQTDIKKVLAYSTVSQLGFMFVACGVGAFWVGMFHVITHAFFKALLFLGSGSVIHAMAHEQDMRRYGNLAKYIKITSATMILGWLAIAGFPFLSGFWSKEAILGNALGNHVAEIGGVQIGPPMGWLLLGVAALTAAYMTRLTYLTFFGGKEQWRLAPAPAGAHDHAGHSHEAGHGEHEAHGPDEHGFFYTDEELAAREEVHSHHHELGAAHEPHESPPSMTVPLVVLAALSVVGGFALYYGDTLKNWLYPGGLAIHSADAVSGHPHGWVGSALLWLSIAAAGIGIAYGSALYRRGLPETEGYDEEKWHPFRRSAKRQFGYDDSVMEAAIEGGGQVGHFLWKGFDAGFVDGLVNGIAFLFGQFGRLFRTIQTGYARAYALLMLIGGVGLLGWLWYASRTEPEAPPLPAPANVAAPTRGNE